MPSSLTVALALRSLVKRPGYVSAVVLTLAVSLRGLLVGIPPFDWATYAAGPVVVVLIATLAAAGPVYRALRITPATTLRRS